MRESWVGMGWDGVGMGWVGMGWDGMGWDGMMEMCERDLFKGSRCFSSILYIHPASLRE